jgi:hypothetical protein
VAVHIASIFSAFSQNVLRVALFSALTLHVPRDLTWSKLLAFPNIGQAHKRESWPARLLPWVGISCSFLELPSVSRSPFVNVSPECPLSPLAAESLLSGTKAQTDNQRLPKRMRSSGPGPGPSELDDARAAPKRRKSEEVGCTNSQPHVVVVDTYAPARCVLHVGAC